MPIKTFKGKPLADLWATGKSAKIDAKMHRRILARLDRLDASAKPEDMNLPGFNFHALKGFKPIRYTVHVNGSWCITFEFEDGDVYRSISSNTTKEQPTWPSILRSAIRTAARPIPARSCATT